MSDAPERIWDFWPDDGGAPIVWRDPCPFPADDAEVVEYTRSDMLPAMLAKAHAEGREQGLREAAAHVGVRVGRHGTGFTQNCQCGMCNARREDHVFILDLLDTPAPDAEEGGE